MADYREILGPLLEGRSYRDVVDIAGCSHRDVARVVQEARERNVISATRVSDAELAEWFPDGRRKVPEEIASQTGPAHWVAELPDRVAADAIVNRLANNARIINLGQIDMRRHRNDQARAHEEYWE